MSNSEMKHPSKLSIAVRSLSQTPAKSTLRHSPKSFSMLALDFGLIFLLCGLIVGCVTQLDRLGGGSLDLKLSRSVSSPLSSSSSSSSSFTPLPRASSDLHPSDSFGSSNQRKILEAPSDDGAKSDPPATTGPLSLTSTLGPFELDFERDSKFAQWSAEFTDLLNNSPDIPTAFASFLGASASSVVVKARQLELSYFVLAVVDYHGTAAAGDERLLFLIKHTWHMLNGASDDPQWALVLFHTTETEKFWLDKLDIRPGGKGENISLARVTSLAPSNSLALPYSGVFIDRLAPAEYVLYLERDSIMLRSDVLPSASATKPNPYFTLEAMMRRWVHVSAPLSWCPSSWQWCSLGGSIGLSLTRRSDFSTLVREIHCDPRRCWSHDNFKDVKYFTNLKREEGTGEILVASAWESKQLTFGCPESGDKIKVLDHSYGRDQGMIDLYSGSMPKGFCHMPTTLPSQCDNKRSCSLKAHFEPDPCPGYEKLAVVSYTCLNPRSKLAQQNQLAHSPSSSQLAKPPEDPQAVWFPQILYQHRKRFPASHFPTSDESAKFAIQSKDVEGVEPYFLHKAWSLPRDRLIQLIAPVKQYYYKSKQ